MQSGWSSHFPILLKAVQNTTGPILELGSGMFSTTLLHWMCEEQRRKLVTLESNPQFYSLASNFRSAAHDIRLVTDWDKEDFDEDWSVALIDHTRGRRAVDALRLKDNTQYIVIHDTDERHHKKFRYDTTFWEHFKYVYHWKFTEPNTSVVSNKSNLNIFL